MLRLKTYSYFDRCSNENKTANGTKKSIIKWKLKFEDYKNLPEVNQLENEINHLENNKLDTNSLKENYKEFIGNNELILKLQKRLRSKKHNVFTEEVNKIALKANGDNTVNWIYRKKRKRNKQRYNI